MPVKTTTLDAIATAAGTFAVVAMDQRGTLRRMYAAVDRPDVTAEEMTALKADILEGVRASASAFLVDPDYGVPAVRSVAADPHFGTLIAAEPSDRGKHEGEPVVTRDLQQTARWVQERGGDAVKYLIQVRADRPVGADGRDLTAEAAEAVRGVVEDCADAGIPSVIENLIYPLNGEGELSPDQRADAIIEAAAWLDSFSPSLLKLE